MISEQHKFLAIFPPKTASTSVVQGLRLLEPAAVKTGTCNMERKPTRHVPCQDWLDDMLRVGKQPSSYFKFMIVRNPWSRAVSHWEYMRRMRKRPTVYGNACKRIVNLVKDFKGFLTVSVDNPYGGVSNDHYDDDHLLRPCYDYGFSDCGKKIIDFIGKFENLQQDFDTICDKIGLPRKKLPHTNKSRYKHYTKYYDEETKRIVAEKWVKDVEYFGYEFGE